MSVIERFREAYPEGRELYSHYSGYDVPMWAFTVWLSLDRWALGVDAEVDPGGSWAGSEHRRFWSLHLGPVSAVLTRAKRSAYAS